MHYANGSFITETDATLPIFDLGLSRGYGVFEFARTYQKRPFHLWDHLVRLKHSASELGLTLPHSLEKIEQIVYQLLEKSPLSEATIKIILTGGISNHPLLPDSKPSFYILILPIRPFPLWFYERGIPVCTTHLERSFPTCKSLYYVPGIRALQQGAKFQAQEALFLNKKREILEGVTSNFFCFKGDTLITSTGNELLLGITREVILQLASPHFHIEKRAVAYEEIFEIEEAFVCSTTKEIVPISHIDNYAIGNGDVGKNIQKLTALFRDYSKRNNWPFLQIPEHVNSCDETC